MRRVFVSNEVNARFCFGTLLSNRDMGNWLHHVNCIFPIFIQSSRSANSSQNNSYCSSSLFKIESIGSNHYSHHRLGAY